MSLSIQNLSVGYRQQTILSGIHLTAAEGELVALIGRNGTGKSTLMRTLARLQPRLDGVVLLSGKPTQHFSKTEWAEQLSIVSTDAVGASYLTVRQLVAFGRFPYTNWLGKLTVQDLLKVDEALQLVGIAHLAHKNLHETSDGERQRAMIARTLAQDTGIILLDEPTAFLDMPNKYELVWLLHRLTRERRKTIVFSTHDLNIAMQGADKLWLIAENNICEGAPEDLALNGQFNSIFAGSNLNFDDTNGEFLIRYHQTTPIALAGEGKTAFWTRKALERNGYVVKSGDTSQNEPLSVSVSSDDPIRWTLTKNGQTTNFDSILKMMDEL
ncbi:MAG: ABC transporter ATP-binding protein [Bacteroidales bacterium]|jgi:iron complex transport system ATP-binding protein|nr:ABC transporter ATP-binding protein [Bacteroidales bacterium]